jgi:hypothetical protein
MTAGARLYWDSRARAAGLVLEEVPLEVTVMERWAQIGALTACVALAFGCDEQTEVQRQTRDLQEAQKNVAQETKDLEGQLEQAKADVARLEQKVALARQGLTDDVLENQKELQDALQAQERRVADELGQAKREAQIHSRDTEAALKQLGEAPVPADPAAAAPPTESAPLDAPPAAPAASDAPREDLVPVRGSEPLIENTPEPDPVTPPPAPSQPTSPVTDPTGAVPPSPPPAAAQREVAPSDPPPPVTPAPAQP